MFTVKCIKLLVHVTVFPESKPYGFLSPHISKNTSVRVPFQLKLLFYIAILPIRLHAL